MSGICLLFAGQSVQETGMCAELWKRKAAREVLERLAPCLGEDLEYLTTRMPEEELALTFNSQRAIHAHHLGHWFAYKAAHPDVVLDGAIGHSMGIVAALVAAEAISVEDSGAFIRARAQAFSEVCKGFEAPMGLAAVSCEELAELFRELDGFPGVSLALHNTSRKAVLGGSLSDLEALARHAQSEGWPVRIRVLKVEGPYHTKAFSPCKEGLRKALSCVTISPPKVPVFMGTSGGREDDAERIRELLVEQADSSERHLEAVRSAYEHGCRRFLEVAYKPQPVTWISDQLLDEEGKPLPGVSVQAVRTEEI